MNDPKDFLDYGDDGKRIIVTTGSAEHAAELRAALRASAHENGTADMRVIEVSDLGIVVDHDINGKPITQGDVERMKADSRAASRTAEIFSKGRSTRGVASMASIAALAILSSVAGTAQSLPATGRDLSRRNSQRLDEERKLLARLRSEQPRRVAFNPNFAAPYGKSNPTQQDLDRIAAAEAKRARKVAKRSKS